MGIQKIYRFRPEREPRIDTFELPNSKQKPSTFRHMHAKLKSQGGGGGGRGGGCQFLYTISSLCPATCEKTFEPCFQGGGRERGGGERERVLIVYVPMQVR